MKTARYLFLVCAGTAMLAFGTYAFAMGNNLIFGGASGLALILNHFTGLDMAIATAVFNIAFLVMAWLFVNKELMIGSIVSSLVYPVFLGIFECFPRLSSICPDPLLASLIGGVLGGCGIGLVMSAGASTGGTDILCVILHRYMRISVGTALNLTDGLIMLVQLSFQPVLSILYGFVYTVIMSKAIDYVLALSDQKVKVTVISTHYEEMRMALLKADVGVTLYQIVTGLDQKDSMSIMTIVKKKYLSSVQKIIHDTDPTAFSTIEEVNEVNGRGFTLERFNKPVE